MSFFGSRLKTQGTFPYLNIVLHILFFVVLPHLRNSDLCVPLDGGGLGLAWLKKQGQYFYLLSFEYFYYKNIFSVWANNFTNGKLACTGIHDAQKRKLIKDHPSKRVAIPTHIIADKPTTLVRGAKRTVTKTFAPSFSLPSREGWL